MLVQDQGRLVETQPAAVDVATRLPGVRLLAERVARVEATVIVVSPRQLVVPAVVVGKRLLLQRPIVPLVLLGYLPLQELPVWQWDVLPGPGHLTLLPVRARSSQDGQAEEAERHEVDGGKCHGRLGDDSLQKLMPLWNKTGFKWGRQGRLSPVTVHRRRGRTALEDGDWSMAAVPLSGATDYWRESLFLGGDWSL